MYADNWTIKAKNAGYRSRAVYKLEEILQKTKSTTGIRNVLDIGSAPGGWSQLIRSKIKNSNVYAIDILDMPNIEGVRFFNESVENIDSITEIRELKDKFDLVISDLAPNISGIAAVDNENIYDLNILTLNTAIKYLKSNKGSLIMKTFQNNKLKSLRKKMELSFEVVQTLKPAASKKQSGEIFLYGAFK